MAWSVPCPECATQNEPDGSGAVLCASCGRFYRAPLPGGVPSSTEATQPAPPARAATYGGMGEIEAHLAELGISFQRVSDTFIQVVRHVGPQTVHVTIDSARTIHIVSATGVADLTLGDSTGTRLHFDPEWKERYDFDLALEDKTFALLNALGSELPQVPDDLPAPPPAATPALEQATQPSVPVPPAPSPAGAPLGLSRTPSSPTVPSQKPAAIAASMMEALRSGPDREEETARHSLAEISAMIPKRADLPTVITDLAEATTRNEPFPRPHRAQVDDAPLPVPAVILPSTPDGKPPVLSPFTGPPPPSIRSTPLPPPAPEPPRPSGRVHIANGTSRDVIGPISARVELEPEPEAPLELAEPAEERGTVREAFPPSEEDRGEVTKPSLGPFRPPGERNPSPGGPVFEPVTRPAQVPVLRRSDEEPAEEKFFGETVRSPTAPRASAARERRRSTLWAALVGLAIGAAAATQVSTPAPLARLLPPTAASEVRAGARAARGGDVDGALAHFRRATELDPRSAPAWRNLGVAYALQGDQVRSAEAYRKYLELEPDGEQARAVRALLDRK